MAPRLPIDSCEALFEKLQWDHIQLEKEWNSYGTFNFVLTAYHLYQDWIEKTGTDEQKHRKLLLPEKGRLLFKVWRDITNATKHWELDQHNQKRQVLDSVSSPQIADWYAYFVAGPVIYVNVENARSSLPELAQVTIWCFKWLLEGENAFAFHNLEYQLELAFLPLNSKSTIDNEDTDPSSSPN